MLKGNLFFLSVNIPFFVFLLNFANIPELKNKKLNKFYIIGQPQRNSFFPFLFINENY